MALTLERRFYDSSKVTQIRSGSSSDLKASSSLHLMLTLSQMQLLEIPGFMTGGGGRRQHRADSGTSHHRNQGWNVLSRYRFQTTPALGGMTLYQISQ